MTHAVGQCTSHTDLQVPVHYVMMVNVIDTLQNLMDTMTAKTSEKGEDRKREDERGVTEEVSQSRGDGRGKGTTRIRETV